jgi:Nif-specific regulatory protein
MLPRERTSDKQSIANHYELNILRGLSQNLDSSLNLDDMLYRFLCILQEHTTSKRAWIMLQRPETGRLLVRASCGLTKEEEKKETQNSAFSLSGAVFRTGGIWIAPKMGKYFPVKIAGEEPESVSVIGVPISIDDSPVGVLNSQRVFPTTVALEEDIRLLSRVADTIAQLVSLNYQVRAREEALTRALDSLKTELSEKINNFLAVGRSPVMAQAQQLIRKIAPTNAIVLLTGEPGVGKSLAARLIHELSDRNRFPFVAVNCSAFPENRIESELFGCEKDAFSGILEPRMGRLEEANRGTIFLKNIHELPLPFQAKLLRFLQDKEFEPVGGMKAVSADVRLIAASEIDLSEAVSEGTFRQDLLFRLNVFPITIPPLRERPEDLAPLVGFFSDRVRRDLGLPLKLTREAMAALEKCAWRGNVRELENFIEYLAFTVPGGLVEAKDLTLCPNFSRNEWQADACESLDALKDIERRSVIAALERNSWVQSRAAKDLGITLRQIGYRVRKYNLEHIIQQNRTIERA